MQVVARVVAGKSGIRVAPPHGEVLYVAGRGPTRADHQLELIADVVATCQSIGAPIWLRGGWAMDFFLGWVTRDHADID